MAPHAEHDDNCVAEQLAAGGEDAGLNTISITKIMNCDVEASAELFRACKDLGFFYLDVRDHPSREVAKQIDFVTSAAHQFYNLPQEEKSTWEVNKDHVSGEEIVGGYDIATPV